MSEEEKRRNELGKSACLHYRGLRCGECYWALYDGDWCMNNSCKLHGESVGDNRVHLNNEEAQILIQANLKSEVRSVSEVPSTDLFDDSKSSEFPVIEIDCIDEEKNVIAYAAIKSEKITKPLVLMKALNRMVDEINEHPSSLMNKAFRVRANTISRSLDSKI
jgi:hypothetical protein